MSDDNKTTSTGIGLSTILGVAFIILKLCKVIDWSWWWVTSPFWIPAAILIAFMVIPVLLLKVITAFSDRKKKEK